MGFAVMFRVTDECTHKHLGERRDRVTVDADGLESVFSEAFDRYGLDYSESTTGVDDSASGDTTEVIVSAVGGSKKPSKAAFKAAGTAKAPTMAPVAEDNDREFNEIADADDDGKSDDDEIIEENENDDDTRETVKNSESNIKASTGKGKSIKAIPPAVPEQKITKRKATLNKKKQRRYAEQDDEDRMIAMLSLGALPDNARSAREKESEDTLTKKKQVLQQKQQRVGVRIGASNATSSVLEQLATTSASVRTKIESLIEAGIVKPTELDSYELEALIALSEADSLAVLSLFEEGLTQRKVGNKSGFLAGILKRYQREKKELPVPSTDSVSRDAPNTIKNSSHVSADGVDNEKENEEAVDTGNLVTHESTTIENGHDHGHSDDEDEDDDGDGDVDKLEAIDELDKITGCPFPDDELLYAIPVCGPYSSLMRYKFRVKLTPGTAKKGKCCKQAVEVFLSGRDASVDEKYLIKGLTDPEMVAIMIGDVKLSTPGLQVVKQQASRKQRGAKKKDK